MARTKQTARYTGPIRVAYKEVPTKRILAKRARERREAEGIDIDNMSNTSSNEEVSEASATKPAARKEPDNPPDENTTPADKQADKQAAKPPAKPATTPVHTRSKGKPKTNGEQEKGSKRKGTSGDATGSTVKKKRTKKAKR